jgi:hypothetical protein
VTKHDGAQGGVNGSARSGGSPEYVEFKAALFEFSETPTPAALVRYLNASRALDGLDPLPSRPTPFVDSTTASRFALRETAVRRADRVCAT